MQAHSLPRPGDGIPSLSSRFGVLVRVAGIAAAAGLGLGCATFAPNAFAPGVVLDEVIVAQTDAAELVDLADPVAAIDPISPVPTEPVAAIDPISSIPLEEIEGRPVSLDWGPFAELAELELSFYDAAENTSVKVTGPYRIVYWDEERVELIGRLDTGTEGAGDEARLTLWTMPDALWAQLSLVHADYLARVR